MCDKLVFDLSQEVEGSPNVFVRKDWINILDNQNQNYSNNQSIIDTSQLSNSNKYMSYREAYLAMPLLMTMALPPNGITIIPDGTSTTTAVIAANQTLGQWGTATGSADYSIGLKNWFGNMIHSFTMDYNGTTIFQQTPLINMWNTFKLMTSLSYQDVLSQGAVIGFFPDDATSFQYFPTSSVGSALTTVPVVGTDGLLQGTTNNTNFMGIDVVNGRFNSFSAGLGNSGFLQRQQLINFDADAFITSNASGDTVAQGNVTSTYGSLLSGTTTTLTNLWKSYIITKQNASIAVAAGAAGVAGVITYTTLPVFQIAIMATIKLKHLHSFFNMTPLLKGVFMKLTLNLNNTTTNLLSFGSTAAVGNVAFSSLHTTGVSNAIGGVNPLMVATPAGSNGGSCFDDGLFTFGVAGGAVRVRYDVNVCVGARCLDSTLKSITGVKDGPLAQSVYLYVPAYTFNPPFEQAILSSPVKQINYTDVYQYQITNIGPGNQINQLITNGIANIKSVLILPYFNSTAGSNFTNTKTTASNNSNSGFLGGYPVYQSPYDPAGCGPTSPLAHITNFNVQISGQNAIYNLQKYGFEQFNNQLYGQNAVNGGLTDGLTSGLVGRQEFDMNYCYYYVNVERMLPVEMGVPKSVQIIGENRSSKNMDYIVFIEYGVKISIDILTGARV
jgi:hypothetical protein